jgi:cellulose synthase/poly-beta-1,6-N-acetylglucosamine synthase-like glycosyltransferase
MEAFSLLVIYSSLFLGLYFQVFILVTFFERKEAEKNTTKPSYLPTVTVAVPCYNEALTLEKTVNSILSLNYPSEKLSVIIVDDGSTDETFDIAKRLSSLNPRIQAITQKNGGKHTALNNAIKSSTSELFGCLDADSMVDSEALMNMVKLFTDENIAAVTPAIKVTSPKTILQHAQRVEYNIGIFTKHILGKLGAMYVTPGPFSIFKKEILCRVGMFKKAHNTEDMEVALRIQTAGFRIKNCHTAFVHTITPPTFKKLYRQRVRWTYGFLRNIFDYRHILFTKKHGAMGSVILPFSSISVFIITMLLIVAVYNLGVRITEAAEKISILGFDWPWPSIDWFFMTSGVPALVVPFLLIISFTIIMIGKKMAEGKATLSWDMLAFMSVYWIITPIWTVKALWNAILAKATPWR